MKKKLFKVRSFLIAKISKCLMNILMWTCKIKITGADLFSQYALNEKCILMLWHNRLTIVPFVLSRYTPEFLYAALISGSRDGDILSSIVHSYKNGRTIRVPHLSRYQALRDIIHHIEERKQIVIITPDGPRGPLYELKPGIVLAAMETQAYVIALDWEAKNYWKLKTWDGLRFPKPFTTIIFTFKPPIRIENSSISFEEAKSILKQNMV